MGSPRTLIFYRMGARRSYLCLVALMALSACSGNELRLDNRVGKRTSQSGDGTANPGELESSDANSAAVPEVIAGAYLKVATDRTIPGTAVVSASIKRKGKLILDEIIKLGGTIRWILLVNGVAFDDSQNLALVAGSSPAADKIWTVSLKKFGANAELKVSASVSLDGKQFFTILPGDDPPPGPRPTDDGSSACVASDVNLLNGTGSGGLAKIVEMAGPAAPLQSFSQELPGALSTVCVMPWSPYGVLCDEAPSKNSRNLSNQINLFTGAVWTTTSTVTTGNLVVDLGKVQLFNELFIFQMFSKGKTTDIIFSTHGNVTDSPPLANDLDWTEVAANVETVHGMLSTGSNEVSAPTMLALATATSTRYLLITVANNSRFATGGAALDSGEFTGLRAVKMFCNKSEAEFVTGQ